MPPSAPRISRRLLAAIVRLDDPRIPIAEVARRVCREAEQLDLTRPSYQQIRVLVHESRRLKRSPSTAAVLVEVALRLRPAEDLYALSEGTIRPLR